MGLLSFVLGGGGLILIGAHQGLHHGKPKPDPSLNNSQTTTLFTIFLSIFASFFIVNSALSLLDAHNSKDAVGIALQLEVLSIVFTFLLYSLLPNLPSPLLGIVGAFAFGEEFLLFYLQRKDPTGVENRYYDLLLVPIAVCLFCTLLDLKSPHSNLPKLCRGLGLILQGTWFIQIGLSLFSSTWVASGCSLHQLSRGNYTLRCKDHPQYHRARAIATLQFNCHLALIVLLFVSFFSFLNAGTNGLPLDSYAPIGAELQHFDHSANFTLDSEDDEEQQHQDDEINATNHKPIVF